MYVSITRGSASTHLAATRMRCTPSPSSHYTTPRVGHTSLSQIFAVLSNETDATVSVFPLLQISLTNFP